MAEAQVELYDVAKQMIANETVMDPLVFNQTMLEISTDMCHNKYMMLLCHERRDYTLFNIKSINTKKFASELAETLSNRGNILIADKQPDGAWEIWIRDFSTNENYAYYLFNYADGVVEV